MDKSVQQKRIRKKDYSVEEIRTIVELFSANNEILTAKHSNDITDKKKKEVYSSILNSVNAVGGQERNLNSIKELYRLEIEHQRRVCDPFSVLNKVAKCHTDLQQHAWEIDIVEKNRFPPIHPKD